MKAKIANLSRLDIGTPKQWRQKFGYYSIFAAVPAILASHVSAARSDEATKPEAIVAELAARVPENLTVSCSNPALLKRQSGFRLPHQKDSFSMLATLGGNDDCPGRAIPGGTYTAAGPYLDSGDTTGANDTVTLLPSFYYYYYGYDAHGPDHVYSFTLTGRGPNPQIEVSATSGTYRPLIYVLQDGTAGGCPPGTGNTGVNELVLSDSRWTTGSSTATLNNNDMNSLPLNVPLHLFVDSAENDAKGSGPYTVRMQDVTIAGAPAVACTNPNPIDCTEFFVRQHYLDFLDREPEPSGLNAWLGVLNFCPDVHNDPACDRVTVSAAFFGSQEFQLKGFFVLRFYKLAFDRLPAYDEIAPDMLGLSGDTPAEVYSHKAAFANSFTQRPEFVNQFSALSNAEYVAALMNRYQLDSITAPDPADPNGSAKVTFTGLDLVARLASNMMSRAQVLRAMADSDEVSQQEYNRAFVAMQYYGYLRRTPEDGGYQAWLAYLDAHPRDFRTMVRGFMDSIEFRSRFGQP
jgi:hypothetical protein